MNWRHKAAFAAVCDTLPLGTHLYKFAQRHFGRLDAPSHAKLDYQSAMAEWLPNGVAGKAVFEVGTGHIPWLPIGFYLAGADKVFSYDLFPRMDLAATKAALDWIADNSARFTAYPERLALLVSLKEKPREFLEAANILCVSPADATRTGLPDRSIDVHFSLATFEHIPKDSLAAIMNEARRILTPGGSSMHIIDTSDHFQQIDSSITKINFLRYSRPLWRVIGGNQFAYCNRMRASDYMRLFKECGFEIIRKTLTTDAQARAALCNGFRAHKDFHDYSLDDLCTTEAWFLLKPNSLRTQS